MLRTTRPRGARRRPDSFAHTLRWTVGVVVVPALLLALSGWAAYRVEGGSLARIAVIPRALEIVAVGAAAGLVAWLLLLLNTYLSTRPRYPSRAQRMTGTVLTMVLGALVTAPLATTSYYAMTQRSTLDAIVTNEHTATAPTIANRTKANPWGSKRRVNVLLLGGDGGVGRAGIRTDTVILLSMDTHTGATTMFSLPRNLRDVPFPRSSPLAELYPDGFDEPGEADGESMLNAVYRNVPAAHPGALGRSDNEGADAVKQAVSGALGLPVDYYLLVNLDGFSRIVDAMGGITVNVNERVAINGETDRNIQPTGWIEPGPDKHLDGFHALWFTRGRFGSTDYKRMERQRCAMRSIVAEASPAKLLARYTQLASASRKILRTDIPQSALPGFVDLGLKVKQQPLRSVVFQLSEQFDPNDPDFDTVHAAVRRALHPAKPKSRASTSTGRRAGSGSTGGGGSADSRNVDATDADADCTYQPVSASDAVSTTP